MRPWQAALKGVRDISLFAIQKTFFLRAYIIQIYNIYITDISY